MGHSSNSFDIDDGYRMICGHPGTSFVAGTLATAWASVGAVVQIGQQLLLRHVINAQVGQGVPAVLKEALLMPWLKPLAWAARSTSTRCSFPAEVC